MIMSRRSQEGFTLVEVLISIAIMGILFIGIFAGMATFLKATVVHRSSARLDVVSRSYSERLTSVGYALCATNASYFGGVSGIVLPAGYTYAAGPTISYWGGSNPAAFGPTCTSDQGLQQISATIRETSTGRQQVLVLVKRES
jgi:prepilin-type N-terminal cleavage/methylation domain-containing protein